MRKTASQIADSVLYKCAASIGAQRTKQYWQLLKRLYGGSDEAVSAISQSRDPFIYHGTQGELVPKIMKEGIIPGRYREHGVGAFFGDKDLVSKYYGAPKVLDDNGWSVQFLSNDLKNYTLPELAVRHNYKYSPAGMVRLKAPWELQGSEMYPPISRAKRLDLSRAEGEGKSLLSVAGDSLLHSMEDTKTLPGRRLQELIDTSFKDEAGRKEFLRDFPSNFSSARPTAEQWALTGGEFPERLRGARRSLLQGRVLDELMPKTPRERYHAEAFGNLVGGFNPLTQRGSREFFIEGGVSPELLSRVT